MKKLVLQLSLAAGLGIIGLTGCYYDKAEEVYPQDPGGCDTVNTTYAAVISPIISFKCATAGCHSGSAPAGGYDFTTYAGLKAAADNGRLVAAIHPQTGTMPKGMPKLPACEITRINTWVRRGAQNN